MTPGFYVVRLPKSRRTINRQSLIIESRPFDDRWRADGWRDFIQSVHPKDEVFVIERPKP